MTVSWLHRLQRFEFRKPSDSLEVETSAALEREGLYNRLDESFHALD
jgi:hypothetical protein